MDQISFYLSELQSSLRAGIRTSPFDVAAPSLEAPGMRGGLEAVITHMEELYPAMVAAMLARWTPAEVHEALSAGDYASLRFSCNLNLVRTTEALIGAFGGRGSDGLRAALGARSHEVLREACFQDHAETVALLLASYGAAGSPEVLAVLTSGPSGYLPADRYFAAQRMRAQLRPLSIAAAHGRIGVIKAIVRAFGGAGSGPLLAELAASGTRRLPVVGALYAAAQTADAATLEAVLEAYGGNTAALLASLADDDHDVLCAACRKNDDAKVFKILFDAYGGLGSAALKEALEADNHGALYACRQYDNKAARSSIAKAYGGRSSPAYKAAMAATKKERNAYQGCDLGAYHNMDDDDS